MPTPEPKEAIHCSGCQNYWTGLAAAHCGKCHRTFTGISAFDLHRVGPPSGGRVCADPELVLDQQGEPKLIPISRQHWLGWGMPTEDVDWADRFKGVTE